MILVFKFPETCHMVCPAECFVCVWEGCVFCCWVESVLYMSVRYNCLIALFKSSVSLLMFCLFILGIVVSGVSKSSNIIVELFFHFYFVYFNDVIRYVNIYNCYIFLMYWGFYEYIVSLSLAHFLISSLFCLILG